MNVTIVGGNLPYPPNAGNRVRTLSLTLRLARAHRISLLYHRSDDPVADREASAYLGDHGVETIGVDRAIPPKTGPAFYARLAANLVSPLPYSVVTHNSPALVRAISRHAARSPVDLWQAEWTPYMKSMRGLVGAPKVVMAHNVESQIWQRYHETERRPHKKWYIARQWRKFERFERRAFAEATRVVAVSDEDAELIRGGFGTDRVDVVDNGIDRAYFESVAPAREGDRIVFLGSFEWRPNLDAVGLLLDEIFPKVLAAVPSAKLDLVGRNPPESLARRVLDLPNVELHANVPDVRPFLARSGVMAVPLRIGGGSRLKILEALAAGLPVVSTRVGAEGLRLTSGRDLAIVERVEEMAAALLGCIRDPNAARAMAECSRRLVLERYDWDVLAARLGRIWEGCLD
jgi:glycosyltransferase involved in cell wall biosynthesis